ncbi:MAG: hypothetical protein JWQ07_4516 [Ramlibacter sp.]|nr:hypothetical protein [Ramlibacter sp.]
MTRKPIPFRPDRRRFAQAAASLVAFPSAIGFAQTSEPYPGSREIKIVVGISPGSVGDLVARIAAERLREDLGVPVVVENKVGASGLISVQAVLNAPADGHTILMGSGALTIVPLMGPAKYDPVKDFAGAGTLGVATNVLVVASTSRFKTVKDLIAAAKARPGTLTYASAGYGSSTFMSAERFRMVTGTSVVHIPLKGSPEALTEVSSGRVDFFFAPLASALPLIKSGHLTALAVGTPERSNLMPELPTLSESGVRNAEYQFWLGFLVASKTPRPIVQRLNLATLKALNTPVLKARFTELGVAPLVTSTEQFAEMIRKDLVMNTAIIKAGGSRNAS